MADVVTEWQIGHLAAAPEMGYVDTADGRIARAHMIVISNSRRKDKQSGEVKEKKTALRWTLWREQAENACKFLGKGAHVAIKGRIENNEFEKNGEMQYGFNFVATAIQYLDSKAEADARSARVSDNDDDIPM